VQVVTGIRTAREVEILSGISAGDSVIVSGVMQLKPAQKVKVIP
jgi:membrane fusion protein (multidrug efflux system)